MKKTIVVLFALAILGLGLNRIAAAQTSCQLYNQVVAQYGSCLDLYNGFSGVPTPAPPTMVCCNPSGAPFGDSCVVPKATCGAPAAAPQETRCQACSAVASQPVDLATGNVFITQTDISLPGLGGGLRLSRTWNSIWPAAQTGMMPFMFGPNWTSTYQERVYVGNDDSIKYARSEGSFWSFATTDVVKGGLLNYAVTAPGNSGATATQDPSNNWTIILKNGEKHTFDPVSGSLTSIIDRNGNTTTLSYDALNRLTTVTDPASRHLYFNYVNNSSFLVSSVTSDVGITVSYAYDAQGRLSQVTRPDTTTISFQYDSNSNITAVLDTNGKVLESHTYDSTNRGLTSSRANGVENVTVQYPAPPPPSGPPRGEQ